jgi:hypothetical protein
MINFKRARAYKSVHNAKLCFSLTKVSEVLIQARLWKLQTPQVGAGASCLCCHIHCPRPRRRHLANTLLLDAAHDDANTLILIAGTVPGVHPLRPGYCSLTTPTPASNAYHPRPPPLFLLFRLLSMSSRSALPSVCACDYAGLVAMRKLPAISVIYNPRYVQFRANNLLSIFL